jgi:hypothetical protein
VSAISKLKARLSAYPDVRFVEDANSLRIPLVDADGFDVALHEADGAWTVSFAGWHEECGSADEALDLVGMGLSDSVRLKVFSRGGADYKWTLEVRESSGWREESETGLLFFRFWRRPSIRYLQNRVLRLRQ